jgi:hypothetical protein
MQLPSGFAFDSLQRFGFGGNEHEVALFRLEAARFALIPGGAIYIGFDAGGKWSLNQDERERWQRTAEEYGIDKAAEQYIREVTLPRRQVELAPFLIEIAATELAWEALALEDPDAQGFLRKHGWCSHVTVQDRDRVSMRLRKEGDGIVVVERCRAQTHSDLAEKLRASGFRFPTSDEWEYACGAGEGSLFRWGDHAPCDRYPTDGPKEVTRRRAKALSAGHLKYPQEGFTPDWDLHRRPNAFGLLIASDPYKLELTAEIGITRGGDGGMMICGGAGFFMAWLALATAYFEEHSCKQDPAEPVYAENTVGRRVLGLG